MPMEKNVRLVNIYIKIHNKKNLTMDDMAFLAKYDRECFDKTCQNVFYNKPEIKPILQPAQAPVTPRKQQENTQLPAVQQSENDMKARVKTMLARLQKLDSDELMVQNVTATQVKELIGNLYMEMLFPHNDVDQYFDMQQEEERTSFNAKA